MASRAQVNISNLIINHENPRHTAVKQEQEAIEYLINEDVENMFNLAKSIVTYGFFPAQTLSILEIETDKGFYTLLDGNRRMTAIKLLLNPELVPLQDSLKKFKKSIEKLSSEWENKPAIFECVIYDNKKEAEPYLLSIHTDDKNYPGPKKWNRIQQDRFKDESDGDVSFTYKVLNKYLPNMEVEKIKNVSTIERILKTKDVKTDVFDFDKEGNSSLKDERVKDILTNIVNDVADSKTVIVNGKEKTLNTRLNKSDIIDYVSQVVSGESNKINIPVPVIESSTNTPNTQGGNNPNTAPVAPLLPTAQNTLPVGNARTKIPAGYTGFLFERIETKTVDQTNTDNQGIFDICKELKELCKDANKYYNQFPIATTALIRNLLEQSLKYIIKKRNEWNAITNNGSKKDGEISLSNLIHYCSNHTKTIFLDGTALRSYNSFTSNAGTKDYFDMVVHHPEKVKSDITVLKNIANCGLYEFIYYILNE